MTSVESSSACKDSDFTSPFQDSDFALSHQDFGFNNYDVLKAARKPDAIEAKPYTDIKIPVRGAPRAEFFKLEQAVAARIKENSGSVNDMEYLQAFLNENVLNIPKVVLRNWLQVLLDCSD
jgi:hypothetical protein